MPAINVVDTVAASTASVVRRLAVVLGWDLDRETALDLYVGLLTDTGRFQYPNTTMAGFLSDASIPATIERIVELLAERAPAPA